VTTATSQNGTDLDNSTSRGISLCEYSNTTIQQQTAPALIEGGTSNAGATSCSSVDTDSGSPPPYSLEQVDNSPLEKQEAKTTGSYPASSNEEMECYGIQIGKHICIGVATY
jgi:hypothetical protein